MKRNPCWVLLCSVLLIFFLGVWGEVPARGPGSQGGPPPVVTVMTVAEREVNPASEYIGRVEAIQTVDLQARVEGYLEQVKFREGTHVAAGDLLFLIEQAPYTARVHEAQARVAESEAALLNATQYLQRLRSVHSGGVSATDLETAANAELRAKALLEQSRAHLEQAEINLGYTRIKAPISGRIGRTSYTKGNLVSTASGSLARIVQIHPIRVAYSMSESDLAGVQQALKAGKQGTEDCPMVHRIRLPDATIYPVGGRLDFVDNQVDAATGTIAIRAVFDNPHGSLLPGQYVTVLVECEKPQKWITIPQSAVQEDRGGPYVFVVDAENQVRQRRIVKGPVIGTEWTIQSGLAPGEDLIIQGIQKVTPGQIVETVAEDVRDRN